MSNGKVVFELTKHNGSVNWIDIKKETLLSGSDDGSIKMWKLNQTDPASDHFTLLSHTDAVIQVKFAPKDRFISASKDNTIRIWKQSTRECLHVLDSHSACVQTFSLTPQHIGSFFHSFSFPFLFFLFPFFSPYFLRKTK